MDRYELRRLDYSLSQDHIDLQAAYRQFLNTHCSMDTVRGAEADGWDPKLWERFCAMGATTMALPESVGGDGATLVDLSLVAEEIGRSLAPVPWIDHVCATRLLSNLSVLDASAQCNAKAISGTHLLAMDPHVEEARGPRLVPSAAVADEVLVREGDNVLQLAFTPQPRKVNNIGHLPMAWIDPETASRCTVIASGDRATAAYQRAQDEWRVLTSAALVGLVDAALNTAVEFAKTRYTLGVPIATLQGISHPLADVAVALAGGRNLTRRAAWYLDNEPDERAELASAAFVFMAEESAKAATFAAHVQGGLGVSAEAPAAGYLVRARGWALAGGDPGASAHRISSILGADCCVQASH